MKKESAPQSTSDKNIAEARFRLIRLVVWCQNVINCFKFTLDTITGVEDRITHDLLWNDVEPIFRHYTVTTFINDESGDFVFLHELHEYCEGEEFLEVAQASLQHIFKNAHFIVKWVVEDACKCQVAAANFIIEVDRRYPKLSHSRAIFEECSGFLEHIWKVVKSVTHSQAEATIDVADINQNSLTCDSDSLVLTQESVVDILEYVLAQVAEAEFEPGAMFVDIINEEFASIGVLPPVDQPDNKRDARSAKKKGYQSSWKRDDYFLTQYEIGKSYSQISKDWAAMSDRERREIDPRFCDAMNDLKNPGQAVKQGCHRARKRRRRSK